MVAQGERGFDIVSYDALMACPGYEHDGTSYNAILEPACAHCRFSWWAHKREGRPHPPKSPPLKDEVAPVPIR